MPVHAISLEELAASTPEQARLWCTQLETGGILYFPATPIPVPEADLSFLLSQQQTNSSLHKNIAYKPNKNELSGVDTKTADAAAVAHLEGIMSRYSQMVEGFLGNFLAPYQRRWQLDYASYRPIEEDGRDLPLRRRNDLLHTDAFPTRPTRGARILRFFHNINPHQQTRNWITGEHFSKVVGHFTPSQIPLPQADSAFTRAAKQLAQSTGLANLVPQWKRTPYDEFMMRLHNTMKEDASFQQSCHKEFFNFPSGSSWMVYTESVPHAVLSGQYALEQTFLVSPEAIVAKDSSPVSVLESLTHARLA